MADASQLMYENLKAEKYGDHREYNLDHPVPLPRASKSRESISNRRSFASTFIVDDQTSPGTCCHIGPRPHDKTYFKNRSKDFSQNLDYTSQCFTPESLKCSSLTESMSLKAGLSSNDLNNTSKYAFNSTEESFVLSSTIVADSRGLADEKELRRVTDFVEGTPRNHLYKPTHFFDIFSSVDTTNHQAWTVVPLKFLHLDCLEPFVLASDEFDQPFILNVGSHKMLREGDRFLELNGLVVIQMNKSAILALFESLPLGCTIRAVVLRKVVGLDTNNNLSDK